MTTQSPPTTGIDTEVKDSWLPMVVIGMGQVQMSLNINALPVSIGNIVNEFDTAPTTVGSAIVAYSLAVAGFVMLGGKLGQKFGSLRIFQIATVLLMIAMIIMTFSSSAEIMIVAQLIAGLAAAAIVPTLVVLIANNYRGKQQSRCRAGHYHRDRLLFGRGPWHLDWLALGLWHRHSLHGGSAAAQLSPEAGAQNPQCQN